MPTSLRDRVRLGDSPQGIARRRAALTIGIMTTTTAAAPGPFARELRRWRGVRRWSQLDLAIRTGTTQRYLSYLEQGRSQPGRTVVMRLAESLGLSLRERNGL